MEVGAVAADTWMGCTRLGDETDTASTVERDKVRLVEGGNCSYPDVDFQVPPLGLLPLQTFGALEFSTRNTGPRRPVRVVAWMNARFASTCLSAEQIQSRTNVK